MLARGSPRDPSARYAYLRMTMLGVVPPSPTAQPRAIGEHGDEGWRLRLGGPPVGQRLDLAGLCRRLIKRREDLEAFGPGQSSCLGLWHRAPGHAQFVETI